MSVLVYRPEELLSHITFTQWHHLTQVVNYLFKANQADKGTTYQFFKSVVTFDPRDYTGYVGREDFLYKLRDVYYWWGHSVSGKLGQRAGAWKSESVGIRVVDTSDPGFSRQFYIFCYALRTIFFEHAGRAGMGQTNKARARARHFNIPSTFPERLKGNDDLARKEYWLRRFNNVLERDKTLKRIEDVLCPPLQI